VGSLKNAIFEARGILPTRQVLLFSGTQTSESETDETAIAKCWSLKNGDTIFLKMVIGPSAPSSSKTKDVKDKDKDKAKDDNKDKAKDNDKGKDKDKDNDKDKAKDKDKDNAKDDKDKDGHDPITLEIKNQRWKTILSFTNNTSVIRPDFTGVKIDEKTSGWPRISQAYCAYTRKNGTITGVVTVGLSNPFVDSNYYAIGEFLVFVLCLNLFYVGTGVEIFLECPSSQAKFTMSSGNNGGIDDFAAFQDSWPFRIIHELAHQFFKQRLYLRLYLEKNQFLSVNIAGIPLPDKYLDSKGHCFILLGLHFGDEQVPKGFNVMVPQEDMKLIQQAVIFVNAKLLTIEESKLVTPTDGDAGRKSLAARFTNDQTYGVTYMPLSDWITSASSSSSHAGGSGPQEQDSASSSSSLSASLSSSLSSSSCSYTK
jgi:hypothetical protein